MPAVLWKLGPQLPLLAVGAALYYAAILLAAIPVVVVDVVVPVATVVAPSHAVDVQYPSLFPCPC